MHLLTFSGPMIPALDLSAPGAARKGRSLPLAEAWEKKPYDAHFVGYQHKSLSDFPRLAKAQVDFAEDAGVKLHWLCFDIDNPGHAVWESPELAESALWATLDILPPKLAEFAGGYTTRAGLRVLFHLAQPAELRHGNHLLHHVGTLLQDVGILVDPACFQWTRLFRAPRATRDGQVLRSVTHAPTSVPGNIHALLGLEPKELLVGAPVDRDCPDAPWAVPDWVWELNLRFPEVTRGAPFDLSDDKVNSGTSVFYAARSAMAHIAQQARIVDPELLLSCIWRSALASKREPSEFWRMACWLCGQEKLKTEIAEKVPEWPEAAPDHTTLAAPRAGWLKAASGLVSRENQSMRELFRRCSKRFPVKLRGTTMFGGIQKLVLDILGGTPLAEDPEVVFAFVIHSFHETRDPIPEKAQDVWELCIQAAEASWAKRLEKSGEDEKAQLLEDVKREWPFVLSTGRQYWVLDARTGQGHYTYKNVAGEQVVPMMRMLQKGMPIDVQELTTGDRGGMCTGPQVLDRCGGVVDAIIYESGLESCKFVDGGRTVKLPCHARRDVNPVFHEDVDKWLQLLAGAQYDRLLRWIGVLTKNTLGPAACLYVQGKKGSGKTLIFHICSKLFDGPMVDYNRVVNGGRFNVEMLGSPLLYADEGIHVPRFGNSIASPSAMFRSFTANFTHGVEEKHGNPTQLNAYLRIGVSANNADGLPFRETLAKEGIEAIVERVFWMEAGKEAAGYLTRLFEDPTTYHAWIHGNHAAEHFAWLQDQENKSDGRFLVQGEVTEWHKSFTRNQGIKPSVARVLSAITTAIMRSNSRRREGAYLCKEGVVVTHNKVLDEWPDDAKMPRHSTLARTLEALSIQKLRRNDDGKRPGHRLFYLIPWITLYESDVLMDSIRDKIETETWEG